MLNRAGVPLATAMSLARHSDPKLTLVVYDHNNEADRRAALDAAFGKPSRDTSQGRQLATITADEDDARIRIRIRAPLSAAHSAAPPRTTTTPERTIPKADEDLAKWLNGSRFRIDPHEDAPPCTGQTKSTPRRTRTTPESSGKTGDSETRGAESGALRDDPAPATPHDDPDLTRLVRVWPDLPEPIRRAVVALIDAGGGR
jgi:hypothetical protein